MSSGQSMSTDKTQATARDTVKVYQLKVVLRDVSPLVWRRLLVTGDTSIAQLHHIVQTAMGWEDLHLHRFRVHGKEYGIYRDGGMLFDDDPYKVTLSAFKLRAGERFVYEYDMGDFWQHDIRVERVLLPALPVMLPATLPAPAALPKPSEASKTYPLCTGGRGDCPPEDCGGPQGYRNLLEERCSWEALEQVREDVLLVAKRLLDFLDGGPRPTYDDEEFMAALDRMHQRENDAPIAFSRRAVNAALRALSL